MTSTFRHLQASTCVLSLCAVCLCLNTVTAYEQGSYFICKLVSSADEKAPAKRLAVDKKMFLKSGTQKKEFDTIKDSAFSLSFDGSSTTPTETGSSYSFGDSQPASDSRSGSSLGFSDFGGGSSTISGSSSGKLFGN